MVRGSPALGSAWRTIRPYVLATVDGNKTRHWVRVRMNIAVDAFLGGLRLWKPKVEEAVVA